MNPLDSFTVERLEELSAGTEYFRARDKEITSLAKIALAVMKSKPVGLYRLSADGHSYYLAGSNTLIIEDVIPLYKAPPAPQLPEGWLMVPKELTAEMAEAARKAHEGEFYLPFSIYRAMLAAAPKPE